MKFVIKLFPEIITKSTSVRARFIKILDTNIRNIIKPVDPSLAVIRCWDHIEVRTKNEACFRDLPDVLTRIPGIHHVLEVETHYYQEMQDIFLHILKIYKKMLVNKTFCVRVKRRGQHPFTSMELERYLGQALCENIPGARVNLDHPEVTVALELQQNQLRLIKARYEGLGGFPTGTQEPVLSLISGGVDSSVSSYMLMRRGCKVHFCFFNLGGEAHETGVQRLAYHLWKRFSSSHQVRFISIDFLPVLNEILQKIEQGQTGVVLKRMMVRAASQIARRYGIRALVTGEAVGQVASQTLSNLHMIDATVDTLILRPLIGHDKEQIIQLARVIGTEPLAKDIPEYCGVISKNPTVKAQPEKIKEEESRFDFSILDKVIQNAKKSDIRTLSERENKKNTAPLEIVTTADQFSETDVLLDIRTPDEQKENPLHLQKVEIKSLPFYQLSQKFSSLDQSKTYFLYCDRGVMSRLQALYLRDQGVDNVKIYQP